MASGLAALSKMGDSNLIMTPMQRRLMKEQQKISGPGSAPEGSMGCQGGNAVAQAT